jgi:hypothetical protein
MGLWIYVWKDYTGKACGVIRASDHHLRPSREWELGRVEFRVEYGTTTREVALDTLRKMYERLERDPDQGLLF